MKSTTLWQIMAFHIIHLSNWIGSTYAQSFKQSKCVDRYIWALSNHFAMASNAETFRFHCCWQCIEQTIDLPVITKASTTYAVTAIQFTTTQSFTDWLIKTHTHTHIFTYSTTSDSYLIGHCHGRYPRDCRDAVIPTKPIWARWQLISSIENSLKQHLHNVCFPMPWWQLFQRH